MQTRSSTRRFSTDPSASSRSAPSTVNNDSVSADSHNGSAKETPKVKFRKKIVRRKGTDKAHEICLKVKVTSPECAGLLEKSPLLINVGRNLRLRDIKDMLSDHEKRLDKLKCTKRNKSFVAPVGEDSKTAESEKVNSETTCEVFDSKLCIRTTENGDASLDGDDKFLIPDNINLKTVTIKNGNDQSLCDENVHDAVNERKLFQGVLVSSDLDLSMFNKTPTVKLSRLKSDDSPSSSDSSRCSCSSCRTVLFDNDGYEMFTSPEQENSQLRTVNRTALLEELKLLNDLVSKMKDNESLTTPEKCAISAEDCQGVMPESSSVRTSLEYPKMEEVSEAQVYDESPGSDVVNETTAVECSPELLECPCSLLNSPCRKSPTIHSPRQLKFSEEKNSLPSTVMTKSESTDVAQESMPEPANHDSLTQNVLESNPTGNMEECVQMDLSVNPVLYNESSSVKVHPGGTSLTWNSDNISSVGSCNSVKENPMKKRKRGRPPKSSAVVQFAIDDDSEIDKQLKDTILQCVERLSSDIDENRNCVKDKDHLQSGSTFKSSLETHEHGPKSSMVANTNKLTSRLMKKSRGARRKKLSTPRSDSATRELYKLQLKYIKKELKSRGMKDCATPERRTRRRSATRELETPRSLQKIRRSSRLASVSESEVKKERTPSPKKTKSSKSSAPDSNSVEKRKSPKKSVEHSSSSNSAEMEAESLDKRSKSPKKSTLSEASRGVLPKSPDAVTKYVQNVETRSKSPKKSRLSETRQEAVLTSPVVAEEDTKLVERRKSLKKSRSEPSMEFSSNSDGTEKKTRSGEKSSKSQRRLSGLSDPSPKIELKREGTPEEYTHVVEMSKSPKKSRLSSASQEVVLKSSDVAEESTELLGKRRSQKSRLSETSQAVSNSPECIEDESKSIERKKSPKSRLSERSLDFASSSHGTEEKTKSVKRRSKSPKRSRSFDPSPKIESKCEDTPGECKQVAEMSKSPKKSRLSNRSQEIVLKSPDIAGENRKSLENRRSQKSRLSETSLEGVSNSPECIEKESYSIEKKNESRLSESSLECGSNSDGTEKKTKSVEKRSKSPKKSGLSEASPGVLPKSPDAVTEYVQNVETRSESPKKSRLSETSQEVVLKSPDVAEEDTKLLERGKSLKKSRPSESSMDYSLSSDGIEKEVKSMKTKSKSPKRFRLSETSREDVTRSPNAFDQGTELVEERMSQAPRLSDTNVEVKLDDDSHTSECTKNVDVADGVVDDKKSQSPKRCDVLGDVTLGEDQECKDQSHETRCLDVESEEGNSPNVLVESTQEAIVISPRNSDNDWSVAETTGGDSESVETVGEPTAKRRKKKKLKVSLNESRGTTTDDDVDDNVPKLPESLLQAIRDKKTVVTTSEGINGAGKRKSSGAIDKKWKKEKRMMLDVKDYGDGYIPLEVSGPTKFGVVALDKFKDKQSLTWNPKMDLMYRSNLKRVPYSRVESYKHKQESRKMRFPQHW